MSTEIFTSALKQQEVVRQTAANQQAEQDRQVNEAAKALHNLYLAKTNELERIGVMVNGKITPYLMAQAISYDTKTALSAPIGGSRVAFGVKFGHSSQNEIVYIQFTFGAATNVLEASIGVTREHPYKSEVFHEKLNGHMPAEELLAMAVEKMASYFYPLPDSLVTGNAAA